MPARKPEQCYSWRQRQTSGKSEPEEILEAFQPSYEQTLIGERAEPGQLYEIQAKLDTRQIYHKAEVEEFSRVFYKPREKQTSAEHARMNACIDPAANRYTQLDEEESEDFRSRTRTSPTTSWNSASFMKRAFERVEPKREDRYRTCVPLFDLEAAAGAFGSAREVEPDGWVALQTSRALSEGMFVARVVGRSMEPRIPNGAWCLFRSPVTGTRQGRIVLVQHHSIEDPEAGGSYTVKRYESEKVADEKDGTTWRHDVIRLLPENPDFEPIVLAAADEGDVSVVAELVEVLG